MRYLLLLLYLAACSSATAPRHYDGSCWLSVGIITSTVIPGSTAQVNAHYPVCPAPKYVSTWSANVTTYTVTWNEP